MGIFRSCDELNSDNINYTQIRLAAFRSDSLGLRVTWFLCFFFDPLGNVCSLLCVTENIRYGKGVHGTETVVLPFHSFNLSLIIIQQLFSIPSNLIQIYAQRILLIGILSDKFHFQSHELWKQERNLTRQCRLVTTLYMIILFWSYIYTRVNN